LRTAWLLVGVVTAAVLGGAVVLAMAGPAEGAPRSDERVAVGREAEASGSAAVRRSAAQPVKVDPDLPRYRPVEGVTGSLKSVGSDTMNNLMALWAGDFKSFYPNVSVEIEGKGSTTAPPALIDGTAQFGPMSRPMKSKELDDFEERFGYKPTELRTAIDMLAVYVHKDNPIAERGLTMQEVDAIFSRTRKSGYPKDIRTWGDLGLGGEWASRTISLYGRNSASGTYGYFKKHALRDGDYKDEVKEMPGSSSVVQGVATDMGGIGYSGIGYRTADVRPVPLALSDRDPSIPAEPRYAFSGEYPLSRFLLVYVNYEPGSRLDPLRREFLRFVFSAEGQRAVIKDGYLPLTAEMAATELRKVGIAAEGPSTPGG